jgi:AraC family transcriptional regulator of adaptative response / DNA-3-methyladenine glycosylase II
MRRNPRPTQSARTIPLPHQTPYDLAGVLAFLARRAIPGVEAADTAGYRRALGTGGGWLEVSGGTRTGALNLILHRVPVGQQQAAVARVRQLFDLDANPAAINLRLGRSALLRASVRRRPGLRVPGCWDGFELAVRAVLGQQISVAAARTFAARLVERFGESSGASAPADLDRAFPGASVLAQADLAAIGLTSRRAETIRGLARAVCEERLGFDPLQPLEDFIAAACQLPGIGPWTAHYIAMRALKHHDAFPAADLVLRQVAGAPGAALSSRQLAELAEAWRPYRSYAVLHLWGMAS